MGSPQLNNSAATVLANMLAVLLPELHQMIPVGGATKNTMEVIGTNPLL